MIVFITSSNDVWAIPDYHGTSRVDLQIAKILDSAEESIPDTQGLEENIESLRKEKEYWKSFMEGEEWNRDTVREVETAWRKRYSTWKLVCLL